MTLSLRKILNVAVVAFSAALIVVTGISLVSTGRAQARAPMADAAVAPRVPAAPQAPVQPVTLSIAFKGAGYHAEALAYLHAAHVAHAAHLATMQEKAVQVTTTPVVSASTPAAPARLIGTPPKPPVASTGSLEYRAMKAALTRIGDPYVWAAAGPNAFDCSGLVVWAYAQEGRYEPHYTGDLWNRGYHVSRSSLRPGDLVFFYPSISHVGIYIGNGRMVDAPHTGTDVQIQSVDWGNYTGAVRIT